MPDVTCAIVGDIALAHCVYNEVRSAPNEIAITTHLLRYCLTYFVTRAIYLFDYFAFNGLEKYENVL